MPLIPDLRLSLFPSGFGNELLATLKGVSDLSQKAPVGPSVRGKTPEFGELSDRIRNSSLFKNLKLEQGSPTQESLTKENTGQKELSPQGEIGTSGGATPEAPSSSASPIPETVTVEDDQFTASTTVFVETKEQAIRQTHQDSTGKQNEADGFAKNETRARQESLPSTSASAAETTTQENSAEGASTGDVSPQSSVNPATAESRKAPRFRTFASEEIPAGALFPPLKFQLIGSSGGAKGDGEGSRPNTGGTVNAVV